MTHIKRQSEGNRARNSNSAAARGTGDDKDRGRREHLRRERSDTTGGRECDRRDKRF